MGKWTQESASVSSDARTLESVKTISQELFDLLQKKVGVSKFSAVYSQIRQSIVEKRRERKETRVMQASDARTAIISMLMKNRRLSKILKRPPRGKYIAMS